MFKHGLIGLGRMGRYHFNNLKEVKDCSFSSIADVDKDTVEIAKKDGLTHYHNYLDMLDYVDSVTVATPTSLHYEIVRNCLLRGKHVLVEKPICSEYKQAEELFNIAKEKNVYLAVGHVERFNGAVEELSKIITKPYMIEARRIGPFVETVKHDNIVLDLMIHDIDLIISLAKSKVKDVNAVGAKVFTDYSDIATATLKFESGMIANITASRISQKKDRRMTIHQKDNYINLDFTTQDINIFRKGSSMISGNDSKSIYRNEFVQERLFVYKSNPLKREIESFFQGALNPLENLEKERSLYILEIALEINSRLN